MPVDNEGRSASAVASRPDRGSSTPTPVTAPARPLCAATGSAWIVRAGGRCQRCRSRRQLTIHHRTYQRLGHERRSDVTVLCWSCHRRQHCAHPRWLKVGGPHPRPAGVLQHCEDPTVQDGAVPRPPHRERELDGAGVAQGPRLGGGRALRLRTRSGLYLVQISWSRSPAAHGRPRRQSRHSREVQRPARVVDARDVWAGGGEWALAGLETERLLPRWPRARRNLPAGALRLILLAIGV